MKIQSHELTMNSQHTLYKSIQESRMSFQTIFTQTQPTSGVELESTSPLMKEECLCSHMQESSQTLSEIIQNLIKMLQEKVGGERSSQDDEVMGYTQLSFYEKYEEHEQLDFSTSGRIVTDNGSVDIDLNFSMSRSFAIENRIDLYTTFDPLVINLEGKLPDLDTNTFSFDLDNDGEKDQISRLTQGNGFLALDKNNDGHINQGSELFGTRTGNGFSELREYDEDENDWIDENDSIFASLQVWLKNEKSKDKELVALGEVGIGAIYLNSESSEFAFKTPFNETLGEMKSSGIFLYENGEVGNISQIDFAKRGVEEEEPLATLLQA